MHGPRGEPLNLVAVSPLFRFARPGLLHRARADANLKARKGGPLRFTNGIAAPLVSQNAALYWLMRMVP